MNNGVNQQNYQNNAQVANATQNLQQPQMQQSVPQTTQVVAQQLVPNGQQAVVPMQKESTKVKKKKSKLPILLILIILGMGAYIFYISNIHQREVEQLKLNFSPVSTNGETKKLDLDSTIVLDLYSKVKTDIREDIASTTLDDQMKLYLAYRQIATDQIYESNCNLYSNTSMEPFICEETTLFSPTAFKEESLQLEVKKLFGESVNIPNANIQLNSSCIGGYQYIAARGEYVQGYCDQVSTTPYQVTKELTSATSTNNTIVLKEKVKYYGSEKLNLPSDLKSGTYIYTFRLDNNYNYVYISKTFE